LLKWWQKRILCKNLNPRLMIRMKKVQKMIEIKNKSKNLPDQPW
jgi:hypothetical protein